MTARIIKIEIKHRIFSKVENAKLLTARIFFKDQQHELNLRSDSCTFLFQLSGNEPI
jgi:hypothetical protein